VRLVLARGVLAGGLLAVIALAAPAARGQEPPARPDPSLPDLIAPLGKGIGGERRARIEEALRKGAHEQAEALLLEAVEREPPSAELLRLLGGVYFVRGNYLGAAVAFKKAEVLAPLDERSRFTLAMSYVVLGHRDWARPELQKLSASAPRNPLYLYWTARFDYDDAQYAAAAQGFVQVIALDGRFVKAHDNLGLCYEALGKYDEAVRSYQEAIRLDREVSTRSPWPPLNLGVLLARLDRLDEAEPLFRESLRVDPRFPQGHYQLGVALEKKGRTAEAVQELEEAARLDASYPEPHYALARIHRKSGDAEKADRALVLFQKLKKEKGQAGPGPH
jgi:tetratricopeptide (TPR) repeat protein